MSDTAPPPVMLAHARKNESPIGWLMSEKLDGCRAWWDGHRFVSRLGNVYLAPEFFLAGMPKGLVLDGELWMGRGKFQDLVGTVKTKKRTTATDERWRRVVFQVFDAPHEPGTFTERLAALERLRSAWPAFPNLSWTPLMHVLCTSSSQYETYLGNVLKDGGEGLMLKKPDSLYQAGRSRDLLKCKKFYDAEAVVTGTVPGKGKHEGRIGALKCQMGAVAFELGTGLTDEERERGDYWLGRTVTLSYQELTDGGIPRFPSFIRERLVDA